MNGLTAVNPFNPYGGGSAGAALVGGGSPTTVVAVPAAAPVGYVGPGYQMQFGGEPLGWFMGMALILLAVKWVEEHPSTNFEVRDVHISVVSVAIIGISAKLFDVGLKYIANKYPTPGLTELANS